MYLIKHKECLDAETVVFVGKSRLGEREYSAFTLNCEHFALWCKTGISSSEQIKEKVEEVDKEITKEIAKRRLHKAADGRTSHTESETAENIMNMLDVTNEVLTQTVTKGGQEMVRAVGREATRKVLTQAVSSGGQEIAKTGTRHTTKEVFAHTASKTKEFVSQTTTKTGSKAGGSLLGGVACGLVIEGALVWYDIHCAEKDMQAGRINKEDFNKAVGKRVVDGVSSVAGSTAGAAIGQVLIPVPFVGGVVGGIVGGIAGRFFGRNTLY